MNYMSQILTELIKLANLIIIISKSVACMNRVDSVFRIEPGIKEESGAAMADAADVAEEMPGTVAGNAGASAAGKFSVPAVEFRNVSFLYAGAKEESLSGLSFAVKRGETVGIIGGTGSGKSTLVNLIPRFYDAASGQVLVDGQDVKKGSLSGLREKIGVVPQKAVLFKGTLRENMLWGREDAPMRRFMRPWTLPRPGILWRIRAKDWSFPSPRADGICPAASGSV